MKKLAAGNWKMNGLAASLEEAPDRLSWTLVVRDGVGGEAAASQRLGDALVVDAGAGLGRAGEAAQVEDGQEALPQAHQRLVGLRDRRAQRRAETDHEATVIRLRRKLAADATDDQP